MAIGKAQKSSEGGAFKQYIGVGSFRVLGVNPNKEQLSKFYDREMQNDPVYVSKKTDDAGKEYTQVRISFMIQADLQNEEGKEIKCNSALTEPLKTTINFFLDSRYRFNKDNSKVQVIDKYGRTAWPTIEQAKNHQIPVYKNGPANLDKDYRPCFRGEAELVEFIINYLNITPVQSYNQNTGTWTMVSHPEDSECSLEQVQNYFKGNFSELAEICKLIPTNRIKLCMGVRTDNEGKTFNTVYTGCTLRNGSNSYTRIKDTIEGSKNAGGLSDTVFSDDHIGLIQDIHEYKVGNIKETDLSKPAVSDDPFASPAGDDGLPFDNEDPFAGVA